MGNEIPEDFVKDVALLAYAVQTFLAKYSTEEGVKLITDRGFPSDWTCVMTSLWSSANIFFASSLLFEGLINTESLFGDVSFNVTGENE
jgi:hypothetical protein